MFVYTIKDILGLILLSIIIACWLLVFATDLYKTKLKQRNCEHDFSDQIRATKIRKTCRKCGKNGELA
jgi:hypothetical protein